MAQSRLRNKVEKNLHTITSESQPYTPGFQAHLSDDSAKK